MRAHDVDAVRAGGVAHPGLIVVGIGDREVIEHGSAVIFSGDRRDLQFHGLREHDLAALGVERVSSVDLDNALPFSTGHGKAVADAGRMEAGVADHVWSVGEFVRLLEDGR